MSLHLLIKVGPVEGWWFASGWNIAQGLGSERIGDPNKFAIVIYLQSPLEQLLQM